MAPGGDVIIPADIVAELQAGSSSADSTHHESVLTIAISSVVDGECNITPNTSSDELVTIKAITLLTI